MFSLAALAHELLWGRRVTGLGEQAAAALTELDGGNLSARIDLEEGLGPVLLLAGVHHDLLVRDLEHFEQHVDIPLDQIGPDDLRSYHAYLLNERKLATCCWR